MIRFDWSKWTRRFLKNWRRIKSNVRQIKGISRAVRMIGWWKSIQKRDHVFRLVIRGAHNDFATLCTPDQVFEIKSAETSNTLLLASPLDASSANKENGCVSLKVTNLRGRFECEYLLSIQVNSILHSKLELIQCMPKLKRIRQLLEQNPYRGHFDDDDEENPKAKVSKVHEDADTGAQLYWS